MSFAWPHLLWLLLAPLGLLVWELTHRRQAAAAAHPKILRAQAGTHALKLAPPDSPAAPGRGLLRPWLCAGLAFAVVALARPQWGRLEEPVFDQSREILLAIDLSRSMLTPDVKPSRLDRTKLLIQSLLEKLAGERVGLVVFSGTAFLQAPLSADYEILREFLPALSPAFLPEGGTNYGAMLDTSIQAFGATNAADRFLVVLSDGEATDTDWKGRLEDLKKKSIRVLTLGVGTVGGGIIPDGSGGLVKDERGAVVLSKLESATLQELARATDGTYRDASSWIDLAGLINATIAAGRKGQFVEKNTVRLVERFQWPLAFGLWCLLVSFYYEFPVRPKPRAITLQAPTKGAGEKQQTPLGGAATLLLLLLSPFALLPVPAHAAAKLAQPPTAAPAAPGTAAPGEPSVLSKIVGRLAAVENHSARDWAELGRETVNWGSRLQSQQQPVPEIPVRDALSAVDLGEKLDVQATDWPKLRSELEALLQKPEDQKQQDKQKQDQKSDKDQKQDQQDKNQQNQDQKNQEKQSGKDDQKSKQDQSAPQPEKPDEKKPPGKSAFGDMQKKEEPPPPPPENMQQVGGVPEKKEDQAKEQTDPALAAPMQKLEQLRNKDSPAQLFQLMEGAKQPAKKTSKDW
jgi:Ca-activated chloride channel family protein